VYRSLIYMCSCDSLFKKIAGNEWGSSHAAII
jgi:hypothetical protein